MTQPEFLPIEEARRRVYSVSKLQSLAQCGWAFYLDRVRRAPSRQATWFVQGSAVHEALSAYEKSSRQMDLAEVWLKYEQAWDSEMEAAHELQPDHSMWMVGGRKSWEVDRDQRFNKGYDQVQTFVETYDDQHEWQPLEMAGHVMSEFGFEIEFDGFAVIGFIDVAWEHRDTGEVIPVDLKTGTKVPQDPYQLGTYKVAIEQIFPDISVGRGAWWMAVKNNLEFQDLSRWTREEVGAWYSNAHALIEAKAFIGSPGDGCFTCSVRPYCGLIQDNPLPIPERE